MEREKIADKADRITAIATAVKSPKRHDLVYFRGKMEKLPVVRLAIDLPIYRLKNGRTQVEQYQYLSETGQPDEFFENGEENISAQQVQHQILLKLSKDERGPIYEELERVAIQSESLLLTSDGVVLNGNRRLAAMRDLFEHEAQAYASFSHVDAVILPTETDEKDLELMEAQLQMAPETKLEYGWVERRLKLRRHIEVLKIPRDQIKATYRFKRKADINIELQQLALAEEYLEEYLGTPHAYREVAQSEQLFKDLEKALRGKSGAEAEIRRLLGYLLAKEARNLGNRVYGYRSIFGQDFDKVVTRYAEDEDIDLTPVTADDTTSDVSADDPLGDLGPVEQNPYKNLKSILEDQDRTEETVEKLSRVYNSLKEEKKDTDNKQAALQSVQKANSSLHDLDLLVADPDTFPRIKPQLDSIISISESLKDQIDEIVAGFAEAP